MIVTDTKGGVYTAEVGYRWYRKILYGVFNNTSISPAQMVALG
jgi:hypothetical protein